MPEPSQYLRRVEDDFLRMKRTVSHCHKKGKLTDAQAVLLYMSERQVVWYWSWELVGKSTYRGNHLSHRAPARASDLSIHRPELVECRKVGRFACYRARKENSRLIKEFLEEPRGKKHVPKPVVIDVADEEAH